MRTIPSSSVSSLYSRFLIFWKSGNQSLKVIGNYNDTHKKIKFKKKRNVTTLLT